MEVEEEPTPAQALGGLGALRPATTLPSGATLGTRIALATLVGAAEKTTGLVPRAGQVLRGVDDSGIFLASATPTVRCRTVQGAVDSFVEDVQVLCVAVASGCIREAKTSLAPWPKLARWRNRHRCYSLVLVFAESRKARYLRAAGGVCIVRSVWHHRKIQTVFGASSIAKPTARSVY